MEIDEGFISLEIDKDFTNMEMDEEGLSLTMRCGSFYIPKENVSRPLGEDSHFICLDSQTIGVADGVGGWAKRGIDAGEYARQLMSNCAAAAAKNLPGSVNPKSIMEFAFDNTTTKGSSTACILTLADGNHLRFANVGDSGFLIVREGTVVYRSPVQQWRFNYLGTEMGTPEVADEIDVYAMQAGDIIVAGTDGLFDNVYDSEIEDIVNRYLEFGEIPGPEELAEEIAEYALSVAVDETASSPFALSSREFGQEWTGGKYDDITVIVCYLVDQSWSEEPLN